MFCKSSIRFILSLPSLLFVLYVLFTLHACVFAFHLGFGLGLFGPACFVVHMHALYPLLLTQPHCLQPIYYSNLLLVVTLLASSSSIIHHPTPFVRTFYLRSIPPISRLILHEPPFFPLPALIHTHISLMVTSPFRAHIHTFYTTLPSHHRRRPLRTSYQDNLWQ